MLALAGALLTAAPAAAAARRGPPTKAQALAALEHATAVRDGRGSRSGRELTPALAGLWAALPSLSGPDRRAGEALLARPDDSQADPAGTHKWTTPEDTRSPTCSDHFCVHWVAVGPDAPDQADADHDKVPDYVAQMLSILETEVYPCESGSAASACGSGAGLGWTGPPLDGTLGGDGRLDIYISNLFPNSIFAYVAADPDQPREPSTPHYSYMVMDKDYSRFEQGDAAKGLAVERVTAAHEYNHVLQNAYDYLEDPWMFESTAVWAEEKAYPAVNDYLQYLPDWAAQTGQPLTTFTDANLKAYGSAVWNHWLDHRYGAAVVRSAWESSVAGGDFAPAAYGAAVAGAGGAGFSDEFDRFAAAVAEWNVPGAGFPDAYPDVARSGSIPVGMVTSPFSLPHTTFALFDVPIPAATIPVIRLTASLPAGVAGGVALVGRTGSDPAGGTVTSSLTPLPVGGVGAVALDAPSAFGRITAVVVNSDITRSGSDAATGDWLFANDNVAATAAVETQGPPVATTGAVTEVTDHTAVVSGVVDSHLLDTQSSIEYGRTTAYGSRAPLQAVAATTLTPAQVTAALGRLKASTLYHYRVTAQNAAGQVAGGDMTFTTRADVTAPGLLVTVAKHVKSRTLERRGLAVRAQVTEPATVRLELRIPKRAAKRLRLRPLIATARVRFAVRLRKPVRLRLVGRAARSRSLARAKRLGAKLVVTAADPSANRTSRTRRVTFAR